MKLILSLFLLLISSLPFDADTSRDSYQEGIYFYSGDWERTLSFAEEVDRLIFIDMYAIWCAPCKKMSRNVFTDKEVGDFFTRNFLNKKIDAEKGIGIELAEKYKVKKFPTLLIVNYKGELIAKTTGYQNKYDLLDFGKKVLKKHQPEPSRKKKWTKW